MSFEERFQFEWNTETKRYVKSLAVLMGIGLTIFAVILIISAVRSFGKSEIDTAFETHLEGTIFSRSDYKGSVWIKLDKGSVRYLLSDCSNWELSPSSLDNFLQKGDSIRKPANTDSLFIYRDGKEYFFLVGDITLNMKKVKKEQIDK